MAKLTLNFHCLAKESVRIFMKQYRCVPTTEWKRIYLEEVEHIKFENGVGNEDRFRHKPKQLKVKSWVWIFCRSQMGALARVDSKIAMSCTRFFMIIRQ